MACETNRTKCKSLLLSMLNRYMYIGVPVRTLYSAKEKTAIAGPSWKGIRKFI